MISKTRIEKKLKRKINPDLVKTIINAKKHNKWIEIANMLSNPKRKRTSVNLEKINSESKEGDIVVVPGKVLSIGELNKKIKIAAFSFSEKALEKLKNKKYAFSYIKDEIKENPEARGVRIIK